MKTNVKTLLVAVLFIFFASKQTALIAQPLPLEVVKCQEFFHNVEKGNLSQVLQCIAQNPGILAKQNEDGYTALLLATQARQTDMVELLVHKGVNIEECCRQQFQAIHIAASNGDLPTLKVLVEHGASIYAITGSGKSIFELAHQSGNRKLKKYVAANFKQNRNYF